MGSTEMAFIDKVGREELTRVHAFQSIVFHLSGRTGKEDYRGTSLSGVASPTHITDYALYSSDDKPEDAPRSFSSMGFLYDEASVKAMQEAGFPTSPSVATSVRYAAPVWTNEDGKITSHFNEASPHPLQTIANYFDKLGVRSFIVSGGHFPSETKESAVVIDVNDPDFITKVKSDLLEPLPYEAAESLSRPNHMNNPSSYVDYSKVILAKLEEYAKANGASDMTIPVVQGLNDIPIDLTTIEERVVSQADYHLKWTTETIDPLLGHMESDELAATIGEIASAFIQSPAVRKNLMLNKVDNAPKQEA